MRHTPYVRSDYLLIFLCYRGFDAIRSDLQNLIPNQVKGPLDRALRWGKGLYTADSVKKKISYLLDQVRDGQRKFLVRD